MRTIKKACRMTSVSCSEGSGERSGCVSGKNRSAWPATDRAGMPRGGIQRVRAGRAAVRTDSVGSWGVCSDRLKPSTRTREAKKSADGRGIRGVTRLGAASSPWEREAWEYPGLPRLQPEIGKVPDYLVEHYGTKEVEK